MPGRSVLVFAPHPDDEVFGCGGAIMQHVEQNHTVKVIIVTDGAHGASQAAIPDYIRQRQNESIAAAAVLNYGHPVFWQYHDRDLIYGEKLVSEIVAAIRTAEADLVYAPSVYEIHPDHRALGMAAVEAVRRMDSKIHLALYEIGAPLRVNLLLDISDLATRKMEAMRCFASQNSIQRYDLDIAALNRYRTYTLPANVTAAEAYMLTTAQELTNDPLQLYQSEHARRQKTGLPMDANDIPLVSVIIRSVDRSTLSDALDSVALQTYPNLEIVVVNAQPSPHRDLGDWCGRFPLRMINSGQQLHRSEAANTGLHYAHGKYLIFLDDDDWFDPDHINTLVRLLAQDPQAVAAYSGTRCIRFEGHEKKEETKIYNESFDATKLLFENYIPIHALVFRQSAVNTENGCRFDDTFDLFEDWDFLLQLMQHGNFLYHPGITANYRIHGSSGTGVSADAEAAMHALHNIVEKWRSLWTTQQLMNMIARGRLLQTFLSEKEQTRISHEKTIAHLNVELEESRTQLKNQTNQLEENKHQLKAIANQLEEKKGQLASTNDQLKLITQSRSWRYTQPLRWFADKIRNQVGSSFLR